MELEGRGAARPRAFSARRFRGALGLCAAAVLVICLLLFTGGPDRSETMEDPPGTGLPQVAFGDVTGEDQIAMSIAFPDGSFQEDLTLEQIKGLFGGGEGVLEALGWEGLNPKGYVIYDGKGEVFWVVLYGEGMEGAGDPSFTMTLANGAIPPDCVVYEETGETVVRGTTVYGNYWNYDQDGDQIEEHVYEASFLAGETGVRFECAGHDQETAEALALAVVQLCTEEPGASLSKLAPEFVPEWRLSLIHI